jgi:hypothetical protein
MTEVFVAHVRDPRPRPLSLPPDPDRVFTYREIYFYTYGKIVLSITTAYIQRGHEREVKGLPAERGVAVVRKRNGWLYASPTPFLFLYPERGKAELPGPVPCSELATRLCTGDILRLGEKLPAKVYSELLATKLRET